MSLFYNVRNLRYLIIESFARDFPQLYGLLILLFFRLDYAQSRRGQRLCKHDLTFDRQLDRFRDHHPNGFRKSGAEFVRWRSVESLLYMNSIFSIFQNLIKGFFPD